MTETAARPREIMLFVEARADAATVTMLVDRQVAEALGCPAEGLGSVRLWRGVEPGTTATAWREVKRLADTHGIRPHGHFGASKGLPDAHAGRRALLLVSRLELDVCVVLVRDADKQPERHEGLKQAREESRLRERVAIGVAVPEREAWLLAGFGAEDSDEQAALATERQRLGFDPTVHADRLGGRGKRDAKVALATLTHADLDRQRRCIEVTPLGSLRSRGVGSGLAEFLGEVEQRLVPLLR